MKTRVQNLFPMLACVGLLAVPAAAQTFTSLHSFTGGNDGANPSAGLIISGNTLYGTTAGGGSSGNGTVFAVNTNGSGFTNLYSFSGGNGGANPQAALILSGNILYGTVERGGSADEGAVFAVETNGSGFTILYSFTGGNDGAHPFAGLILSGNTLYGTTFRGGSSGEGAVFAVNTNGSGFTNLYSFTGGNDGDNPQAGLILSGNTLYGTTFRGGSAGGGAVFAVNTNGSGFTNLYSFSGGNDGANPQVALILSGNTLYGTTANGGSSGYGTVFAINTNGSGFTNLYSFSGGNDGANPQAGLILSGNTLYGTTANGGSSGSGTVFAVNTNGSGLTNLYSFTGGSDGNYPQADLILSGNTLYGTTEGFTGNGSVFALGLPGAQASALSLSVAFSSGNAVVISWPSPSTGFVLQQNTNVEATNWTTSGFTISDDGTNKSITISPAAGYLFFRLKQ
jgi:uncharacterized repeat protein (TIGR03803 family)